MVLVEDQLQVTPVERALSNWLATWRSLKKDCVRLQMTALKYQQLIELAAKQVECFENIFKEPQFVNDKFIKCISNTGEKDFIMQKELEEVLDKIIILKNELCLTNATLEKQKSELKCVEEKFFTLTTKSESITESLQECQVINKNLRERNRTLQAVKREAMELYRSRDLMFVYQLFDKTQEIISVQDKTKEISYVSTSLQANIDQIQLQEGTLRGQLATEMVKRNENSKYLETVLEYMRFLWECVESLALSYKLEEPCHKFQFALILL